ncbi:S-adenosyl-L-methionine-dependent methyltransferase [Cyathus striatus]|nr:S-adenosyl-L-methionine-dependent methyltransferase [Cyathus striatus]
MYTITLRPRMFTVKASSFLERSIISYARYYLLDVLQKGIKKGKLTVTDNLGSEHLFGDRADRRHSSSCLESIAEAYMEGDFEVSSLKDMMNLWLDNRKSLSCLANTISNFFAYYSAFAINFTFRQKLEMAKADAAFSYDISNDFMKCFLSDDMMYSAALWSDKENGPRGDLTVGLSEGDLEAAQQRKIQHFLKKARLRPGDRYQLQYARLGCFVEAITLSAEQKMFADKRVAEAGLSHLITVRLCDYRDLPPEFKHSFDACIGCEVVEHVGHKNYGIYFGVIDWALKVDRGIAVMSSTTQPEHRYSEFQRFEKNFKGSVVEEMKIKYPSLQNPEILEVFVRKWRYIFIYAEVGYARAYTSLHQFTFVRPLGCCGAARRPLDAIDRSKSSAQSTIFIFLYTSLVKDLRKRPSTYSGLVSAFNARPKTASSKARIWCEGVD